MTVKASLLFIWFLFLAFSTALSQFVNDSISCDFVSKTINYLASDKLKGRGNYTSEQIEAAEYVSNEFTNYGLDPFPGYTNFYLPFRTSPGKKESSPVLEWNGKKIDDSLFLYFSHHLISLPKDLSDFIVLQANLPLADSILYHNWRNPGNNLIIWIALPDKMSFSGITKKLLIPEGVPSSDILLVVSTFAPVDLKFSGNMKDAGSVLYNVVGMIPGRTLPEEAIIFSAHYDHLGSGSPGRTDEIFNGANDNASGTTAVLALARYFALRRDNERTLLFCLFAGEELGLLGSTSFVNLVKPGNIKAVINIEMIGVTNTTGKNAFMLTGSYHSNLIKILKSNLKNEKVKVMPMHRDPNLLFQRSDNYPFAQAGVPAHTIMCSDDNEPCYHKPCDDVNRIDLVNMTSIIQAIAKACTSLVNGKDTPTRIKK